MTALKAMPTTITQYQDGDQWTFLLKPGCEANREVARPSDCTLMLMVYRYLLERNIDQLQTVNCHGCQFNQPGQRDHMVNGCLMEWGEAVEMYLALAQQKIDARSLEEQFRRVLNSLNLPDSVPTKLPEKVLQYNSPHVIAEAVKARDVPEEYRGLFEVVLS